MFFSSFLIIVIVSSNCSLLLVFHMWVSVAVPYEISVPYVVSVRVSFFVFGGSGNDSIVKI